MKASAYFEDENRILPCLYDPIFKELFGNEDHPEIVASLMGILLNIPFNMLRDKIVFLQKGLKNARYLDKNGEKDVVFKVSLENPFKILLEANFIEDKDDTKINRNFHWLANIYGTNLKKGESYENIIPTFQYNFNLFFMNSNKKKIIYHYKVLEVSDFDDLLENETFEIYHLNIEEMKNIWYNEDIQKYDEETRQIILFCALMIIDDKKDFYKCLEELKIPKDVKKEIGRIVTRMNNNEEIYYEFFDRKTDDEMLRKGRIQRAEREAKKRGYEEGHIEGMTKGHAEGLIEGRAKGRAEGRAEGCVEGRETERKSILANMKKTGMQISEISKVTLIPESQIRELLR